VEQKIGREGQGLTLRCIILEEKKPWRENVGKILERRGG
jgi:hypothetical protein